MLCGGLSWASLGIKISPRKGPSITMKPIEIKTLNGLPGGMKLPQELLDWIEQHKTELLLYPNHYLLITLPKGIVAAAETQELLFKEAQILSQKMEQFTAEELKQPCYMIATMANVDRSKWGQA